MLRAQVIVFLVLLGFVGGCSTQTPSPPVRNRDAELSYASATARAFFQTLQTDGNREQLALTTKAFQDRQKDSGGVKGGWTGYSFYAPLAGTERDSPDWSEWLLPGSVYSKVVMNENSSSYAVVGDCQVRVVKESDGKWRVDSFDAQLRK